MENCTLSKGGGLTLAKSVTNSLPLYYFSILKAQKRIINEIENMARNFFSSGISSKCSCRNLVNWGKASLPLQYGGFSTKQQCPSSNSCGGLIEKTLLYGRGWFLVSW